MAVPKEIINRIDTISSELATFANQLDGNDKDLLLQSIANLMLVGIDGD